MSRLLVTPWDTFIDIDWLACAIAYAELLRREGKEATALIAWTMNASVPPFLKPYVSDIVQDKEDDAQYIFVDMSNHELIERFVGVENVIEIYDHHHGWEAFWQATDIKVRIELIGAAATLIVEEWGNRADIREMSLESASLLAHAIVSNTVNFQISVESIRDQIALDKLIPLAWLSSWWEKRYFFEQQKYIESHPRFAIQYDTKTDELFAFSQIEIWESESFLKAVDLDVMFHKLGHKNWLINIVDIQHGTSLIVSNTPLFLETLSQALGRRVRGNTLQLLLMLRKQLYPIIREKLINLTSDDLHNLQNSYNSPMLS